MKKKIILLLLGQGKAKEKFSSSLKNYRYLTLDFLPNRS